MGIAFITAKAERFKHQRDAAFEDQLLSENLFSGLPEIVRSTYRCRCVVDELPEIGTPVLLYRSEGKINVFHLNKQIGVIMSPDSSEVGELMLRRKTEAFAAHVVEQRPISRVFLVLLLPPNLQNE
jgi:hypothetical protein